MEGKKIALSANFRVIHFRVSALLVAKSALLFSFVRPREKQIDSGFGSCGWSGGGMGGAVGMREDKQEILDRR